MRCKLCQPPACCPPSRRRLPCRSPPAVDLGLRGSLIRPCPRPLHRPRRLRQRRVHPHQPNERRSRRPSRTGPLSCRPDRPYCSLCWQSRSGARGLSGRRLCRPRRKSRLSRPTTGMLPRKVRHRRRDPSRPTMQALDWPRVCRKLNRRPRPGPRLPRRMPSVVKDPRNRRGRPRSCNNPALTPPTSVRVRRKHRFPPRNPPPAPAPRPLRGGFRRDLRHRRLPSPRSMRTQRQDRFRWQHHRQQIPSRWPLPPLVRLTRRICRRRRAQTHPPRRIPRPRHRHRPPSPASGKPSARGPAGAGGVHCKARLCGQRLGRSQPRLWAPPPNPSRYKPLRLRRRTRQASPSR